MLVQLLTWSSWYSWSLFFLSSYLSYELKTSHLIENYKQKQPSRGILKKSCSKKMQQVYRRAPMPKCNFNKVAKHLDDCFSIRHIKHRIPLLFTQVSISYLPKSYRKIKFSFYFHTVYTGVFSSCSYRSSYSGRFFSTAILLSYRFLSSRAYQNIY